jgi:hypothetical protein
VVDTGKDDGLSGVWRCGSTRCAWHSSSPKRWMAGGYMLLSASRALAAHLKHLPWPRRQRDGPQVAPRSCPMQCMKEDANKSCSTWTQHRVGTSPNRLLKTHLGCSRIYNIHEKLKNCMREKYLENSIRAKMPCLLPNR